MKNFLSLLFVILLGTIFYSLTLRGVWGNPQPKQIVNSLTMQGAPFESSHERSPYALILAYTTYGRFDLTQELADMGSADVSYYRGKFYSYFPPGLPFLVLPFYIWGYNHNLAQIATFSSVGLFGIFSMIFVFLISRNIFKLPIWAALLSALIFGFGTTSWSYATTIYQHIVTTFFLLSSFYGVWKFGKGGKLSFLYALYVWLSYGFAILLDYPNALLFIPVMIYFLISAFKIRNREETLNISFRPVIIFTSITFILITTLHGYYNYVNYGDAKKFAQTFARYEQGKLEDLLKHQKLAQEQLEKDKKAGVVRAKAAGDLQEENIVLGLYELLVADDKGIFFYSPVLLLGVFYIFKNIKVIRLEDGAMIGVLIMNIMIYASFHDPWGGYAYGPRYLIPSMGILAIFSSIWLYQAENKLLSRSLFLILFSYSAFIALLGVLTTNMIPPITEANYFHEKYHNYLLNLAFWESGKVSSFIYNNFLHFYLSTSSYLLSIYFALMLIVVVILIWSLKNKTIIKNNEIL